MSKSAREMQEMTERVRQLEEENTQLLEQVNQYKSVCESQQTSITEKDNLLEQYREQNDSLKAKLDAIEEKMEKSSSTPMDTSGSGNQWEEFATGDEPDQFKMLYVGNMSYDTDEDALRKYFEEFGEVVSVTIKKSPQSNKSRGFGFVMFKSADMVDNAQENRPHELAGRKLDTQRALPREDAGNQEKIGRTTGLFIGGINRDTSESQIREYFEKFGEIKSVVLPTYKDTGKAKGFSFVNFGDYDIVDKLVLMKHHMISGFRTEVKRGLPRDLQEKRHRMSGGGGYQGDGGYGFDSGYDDGADSGQAEALAAYFATLAKTVTSGGGFRGRGNSRPMRGGGFNQRGLGPYGYGRPSGRGGPRMY